MLIFVLSLIFAFLAAPIAVEAQQAEKVPLIGILADRGEFIDAFKRGLREQGFVERKNIAFEHRSSRGKVEALRELAAELVRRRVDVIFAPSTPASLAAKEATSTIPIVFATVADPIGAQLVANLARPGGNLTGLTTLNVELWPKRVELLKEAIPKILRVAFLFNAADPSNLLSLRQIEGAAKALGVTIQPRGVRRTNDFEGAFTTMTAERTDAVVVAGGILTSTHSRQIVDLAARTRIPAMYGSRDLVDAGGLMCYAANFRELYHRAAAYVDKILKGARPSDLPVEQAARFELVINLKTAKALGLTIPPSLLLRADQVIE